MKNMDVNIPLEFRTFYWLIRSFPNRGTEILSMKRNCLKTFIANIQLAFLPLSKMAVIMNLK